METIQKFNCIQFTLLFICIFCKRNIKIIKMSTKNRTYLSKGEKNAVATTYMEFTFIILNKY